MHVWFADPVDHSPHYVSLHGQSTWPGAQNTYQHGISFEEHVCCESNFFHLFYRHRLLAWRKGISDVNKHFQILIWWIFWNVQLSSFKSKFYYEQKLMYYLNETGYYYYCVQHSTEHCSGTYQSCLASLFVSIALSFF